ncbi:MAG TPA: hypothetical protein VK434_21470 [Microvirga sp.]|nr:hypothetical protein [Microvirga sp.]
MHRHILGVVAATLAAPYLVMLVPYLLSSPINRSDGFGDLRLAIRLATGGLVLLGLPTLILASICAAILHRLKIRAKGWCMLGGAGVGLGSLGVMVSLTGASLEISSWRLLMILLDNLLSGAICGCIYWRIAIARTPENARAIEAA